MGIHFQLLLLSLLWSSLFCERSRAAESYFQVIKLDALLPASVCSKPKGANNEKGILRLSHRYGPCSPFGHEEPTPSQILQQDQYRVNSLQTLFRRARGSFPLGSANKLPASQGTSVSTGNYVVTIKFGTPTRSMTVAFDTGSDLTWIQCKPCAGKCYRQQDPLFDPSDSSTYQNISCSSPECLQLPSSTGNPSRCSSSTCVYTTSYGDGSISIGFFGRDKLELTPSDVVPNFLFGCGQRNDGLFGRTAGLLGLGRGKVSLISQTANKFGKIFSYCLPSTSSSPGYLNFGTGGISSNVKYTPLVTNSNAPSLYVLELTGISVAGQKLNINPSTFASPGTIIDSGTVITRLPMSAYAALRSAFRESLSNYTMAPGYEIFDTCYDFSGQENVNVPVLALHFGNVDVQIAISGMFYLASSSQTCLAFAGNRDSSDPAIIGNRQQRTLQVVYDLASNKVGFGDGGCK